MPRLLPETPTLIDLAYRRALPLVAANEPYYALREDHEAHDALLAIAEGWHRGPTAEPEEDPTKLGPIMLALQEKARKNAGMNGVDLD